jgi:hypothetical protein
MVPERRASAHHCLARGGSGQAKLVAGAAASASLELDEVGSAFAEEGGAADLAEATDEFALAAATVRFFLAGFSTADATGLRRSSV